MQFGIFGYFLLLFYFIRVKLHFVRPKEATGSVFARATKRFYVYSCFEKGCLTNTETLTRQFQKLLWVMVGFTVV